MANRGHKIKLAIGAEETVINDTIRVVASVSGMITSDRTDTALRASIKEMMESFIPGANWIYSGFTATPDPSGFERVALTASTRVSDTENRRLDQRRINASRPEIGLTISEVEVDLSFPAKLVEESETRLIDLVVEKAKKRCSSLAIQMNLPFKVSKIDFLRGEDAQSRRTSQRMSTSMLANKQSYGAGFGDDTTGHAQKISIVANVTFYVSPER